MIDPLVALHLQLDELQTCFNQVDHGAGAWIRYVELQHDADASTVAFFHHDQHVELISEELAGEERFRGVPRLSLSTILNKKRQIENVSIEYVVVSLRAMLRCFLTRYVVALFKRPILDDSWFSYEMVEAYTNVMIAECNASEILERVGVAAKAFDNCKMTVVPPQFVPRMIADVAQFGILFDERFRARHTEVVW